MPLHRFESTKQASDQAVDRGAGRPHPAGTPFLAPARVWQPDAVRPAQFVSQAFRGLPPNARTVLLHARGRYAPWEAGFDFTPPATGPDEVVAPPDFIGVGVQKAGTSWWYELISEHPDVFERADIHKERHFFTRFCVEPFGPADIRQYHQWFPRRPGTIAGEWTPDYFAYPWVAPLLAEAAPQAKLLVLVRDPIDRFRSGLTFRRKMGAPNTSATVADAVRQGFYARWLRRLYEFYPPDQVLVQQYEQCRSDPQRQLDVTYEFLGLDTFRPPDVRREVNVSGGEKVDLDPEAEARLVETYHDDVVDLAGLVPSLDLSLWPRFAEGGSRP